MSPYLMVEPNQDAQHAVEYIAPSEANTVTNPQGGDLSTSADELVLKVRKPYTITKQRERWTEEEHNKFLEALKLYGRAWRRIQEHVGTKTAVQIRSHAQKFFTKLGREQGILVGTTKELEIPPPRPKRKPNRPYPRKASAYSSGSGCEANGHSAASSDPIGASPTVHESPSKSTGFLPYIAPPNKQPSKSGDDDMKLFGHTVVVPTTRKPIPAVISKVDKDSGDCNQNGDWSGAVDFQKLADDPENTEKRQCLPPAPDHSFKTLTAQHPFVPELLGNGQCPGLMLEFMKHMCAGLPVVPNPNNGQCSRSTTPECSPMVRAGALAYAKYMEGITKLQIPENLKDTPGVAGSTMPWQLTPPANTLNPGLIAAAAAITWPFSGMPPPAIPPTVTGENLPFQAEFTTPLRDASAVAMATIAAASAWWTLQGCFPPNFATRHMSPSCGPQITNVSSKPKEPVAQIVHDEGKEAERPPFKLSFVSSSKSALETSQNQGITVSSTRQLECKALKKITNERLQGNESKEKGRHERWSISGSFSSIATDKGGKASPSFSISDDSSASDAAVEQLNGDGDVFAGSGPSSNSSRCETPGSDENVRVSDSLSSDKERESDPYENIVQGNTLMQLQRSIERTPTDGKTCNGQKHCPDNSLERGAKSFQGVPQRLLRPCKTGGFEGEQRKEVSEEGRMAFQALFTREKLPQIFYSCAKRKVNNDNDQLDECNNQRGGAHGASKAPRNVIGDPFSSHRRKSGFNKAINAHLQESDSPEEVVLDKDSSCTRQRPQPKVQTFCTMDKTIGTGTNSNSASSQHSKSFDGIGFVPYRKLMNECKLNCRSEETSSIKDSIRDRNRCFMEEDVIQN